MNETPQTAGAAKSSVLFVLSAGVLSAAAVFALLYLMDRTAPDFHIMGWYADGILPVGAILVGALAGSGYGVASWLSGAKVTRGTLWTVVALQIAVYFTSQVYEFRAFRENAPAAAGVTFWQYFDVTTRNFAWKKHDGQLGNPLEEWGYGVRFLEIAGFALGGLVAPAILRSKPYCEPCQVYCRTRSLALIHAGVPVRKVKKKDTAGLADYQQQQQQALEAGLELARQAAELVKESGAAPLTAFLACRAVPWKAVRKTTRWLNIQLQTCPRCLDSTLLVQLSVKNEDNKTSSMQALFSVPVPARVAQELLLAKK